jgi:hypothetical protein
MDGVNNYPPDFRVSVRVIQIKIINSDNFKKKKQNFFPMSALNFFFTHYVFLFKILKILGLTNQN